VPGSADHEEESLSRFVVGEADLPTLKNHLGWLWRLADLAPALVEAGARKDLFEQVTCELLRQPRAALLALADEELSRADVVRALIATGIAAAPAESHQWTEDEQSVLERLWAALPAAATIAVGDMLTQEDAAIAQCGDAFAAILNGQPDRHAHVGRFGPEAERMAMWPREQVDALWQAAAVVPKAMLDADTRLTAARRMFDARYEPPMRAAAVSAKTIVQTAEMVIRQSRYPDLADAISARKPSGGQGWLALSAMSIAIALLARLAARGNSNCVMLECDYRGKWGNLALYAPELVAIDVVLAEALVVAAQTDKPEKPEESS
jgi:hypothetical protein